MRADLAAAFFDCPDTKDFSVFIWRIGHEGRHLRWLRKGDKPGHQSRMLAYEADGGANG